MGDDPNEPLDGGIMGDGQFGEIHDTTPDTDEEFVDDWGDDDLLNPPLENGNVTPDIYGLILEINHDYIHLEDAIDKRKYSLEAALSECKIIIELLSSLREPCKKYLDLEFFRHLVNQAYDRVMCVEYFGVEPHEEPIISDLYSRPLLVFPGFFDRFSSRIPGLINPQEKTFDSSMQQLFNDGTNDSELSESDKALLEPIRQFLESVKNKVFGGKTDLGNESYFSQFDEAVESYLSDLENDFLSKNILTAIPYFDYGCNLDAFVRNYFYNFDIWKLHALVCPEKIEYSELLSANANPQKIEYKEHELSPESEVARTSITSRYITDKWTVRRLIIDLIQNHLPNDSVGTLTTVEFLSIADGEWHKLSEIRQFDDSDIESIRISDDGRGYSPHNLFYLLSEKSQDSAGQFGEGLKMASGAALKHGLSLTMMSQDWIAFPYFQLIPEASTDEEKVYGLNFDVRHSQDGSSILGSRTIISDLSPEVLSIIRNLGENILYFGNIERILSTENAEVLRLPTADSMSDLLSAPKQIQPYGKIYIKGLLIPEVRSTILSYNFPNYSITNRDRDNINIDLLSNLISEAVAGIRDKETIRLLMRLAKECAERNITKLPEEFMELFSCDPETAQVWIEVFREEFGSNTAPVSNDGNDRMADEKAKHMGFDVVHFPYFFTSSLQALVGPDGDTLLSYDRELEKATNPNNYVEVTPNEDMQTIIRFLLEKAASQLPDSGWIDSNRVEKIIVYKYNDDYLGKKLAGFSGEGQPVYIREDIFNNITELLDVFYHESVHSITGAEDPDPGFRDFLTHTLAMWTESKYDITHPDPLLQTDTTISELSHFASWIRESCPELSDEATKFDKTIEELLKQADEARRKRDYSKLREITNKLQSIIGNEGDDLGE